ncbi:MAG: serine hydrolase [Rhodocyclales bacterium]|nr:serine hydrolase [Rhodocyclales bacterium]
MNHGNRFLVLFLFLASWIAPSPARADHESAEAILGQWQRYQSRLHILKPAKVRRELAQSKNQEAVIRIAGAAKRFADETMSAMIIENGDLLFEGYAHEATRESKLNAYSMTKSLTALAVGEAFCAGKIKSLNDPASTYAPQLGGTAYGSASVRNLLSYTSGAQDPGGDGYAGIHDFRDFRAMVEHKLSLVDLMKKYGETSFEPGKKFIYNGLDSEALSLVVRGATGMPLPQWFEATVWQKAGAEFEAGWFLDRDGNGVAEVLLFATTRDFARVGLYVLDRLTAKANEPCMNEFMKDAATPHVQKGYWDSAPRFGLGLHVGADGNTWIFGHGGQRIGINAKTGRVVATNGSRQWRGYDDQVQSLLAY